MEKLKQTCTMINQNDYLPSIHLADVFLHVLVHQPSRRYLQFAFARSIFPIPGTAVRPVSFPTRFYQNSASPFTMGTPPWYSTNSLFGRYIDHHQRQAHVAE